MASIDRVRMAIDNNVRGWYYMIFVDGRLLESSDTELATYAIACSEGEKKKNAWIESLDYIDSKEKVS